MLKTTPSAMVAVMALFVGLSCKPRDPQSEVSAAAKKAEEDKNSCLRNNAIHYQSWDVGEQAWVGEACFQLGMDLCPVGPAWILMNRNFYIDQHDGVCEFSYGRPDLLSGLERKMAGVQPLVCKKITLVKPDRALCELVDGSKELEL